MLFITMPILFYVESNNLITQCIMRFRYLVNGYDGFSHCTEKKFISIDEAEKVAKRMVMDVNFVKSVTLYSRLSDDSCGPIRYSDEFRYEDL